MKLPINSHYSNAQHLSSQFKKVTGMTPSQYKQLPDKPRKVWMR
ncbi:MAG: AraC family transcriptional regulator [Flavobacteriales bacterium AspAUS03]